MKISLITPSFNQADYLEKTLQSVLQQRGDFELEYIVIDGGSTDGSVSILERYDDRIQWQSKPDNGQIDAINQGFRKATGDVVGWVNSDDLLLPGCLGAIASAFSANYETQWLHGGCIVINEHDNEIRKYVTAYKRRHALRFTYKRLLICNFVSQMSVFWRRELMDSIGFLNAEYPLAFDYDYWLRFAKQSEPVYLDQNLSAFRWYPQSKSGANVSEQFQENMQIAYEHGLREHHAEYQKRFNHFATIAAYKALSFIRPVSL